MTFAPIQNRLGVQPVGTTVNCVNKSGETLAIGDLVITSFIHAGAVVNPEQAANTAYVFNCVRKALSTETGNTGYLGAVTGLMSGAGVNGREVQVQFGGICSAKVLVTATVTPGTLLGVSTTAGVLTNSAGVLSPGGYSVTLMDNAAVADGTSIKRVYIPQEYNFNTGGNSNTKVGLYGSTRADTFIKDCVAGTDSVDVITIGDSNVGYQSSGLSTGFREALAYRGALQYATCLSPLAENDAGNGTVRAGGTFTNLCEFSWVANTSRASESGNSTKRALNAAVTAADSNAVALSTAVGTFANYRPSAFIYDAAFVSVGSPTNTYTSGANGVRLVSAATTAFAAGDGSGGVPLQYRVVYGTFASGSGQFKLTVARATNTNVARSGAFVTNTGTAGISTTAATLNFNSPEVSNKAVPFACNVDGFNGTAGDFIVGPAAFFWHSLMLQTGKGYSVTNLTYYSGRTTAQLATDMASSPTLIRATLRELRTRQIVAGGSGRVLVLNQSGINDGATGASYTTNLDAIVLAFRTEWATLGYPAADLAFLMTSTHPTPNSIGGEAWFGNRPTFNSNAQAWATANAADGRNITYCDFGAYRTAAQMIAAYQYSFFIDTNNSDTLTPYAVHLRTSAIGAGTTYSDSGVTTIPNPTPGGSSGWSMPTMSSENAYMSFGNYMIEQMLK